MSLSGRSISGRSISASGGGSGLTISDPVIDNPAAVQRDTNSTYLVDVSFELYQAQSLDVTGLTVEWSDGAVGPWTVANAQTIDWQHTATTPVSPIPAVAPGNAVNFVWNAFFDLPEGVFPNIHFRITAVVSGASAQVIIGPFPVTTVVQTLVDTNAAALARKGVIDRTPFDYLGCGIVIPFRRGSRDIANGCDVDLIKSTVAQILGTRAAHGNFMGDLKWRPDFGSKLWVLRHRQNDPTLQGQAFAYVLEALEWEPRVNVTEVEIEREPLAPPNQLQIRVRYEIISEDSDDNRVLLPGVEEVVTIGA